MTRNGSKSSHSFPKLDPVDEAKANQWSVWAISEIEPQQMQVVIQKFFNRDNIDQSIIDTAIENLQRPLAVLNEHLEGQDYLLGDRFTIADLNLAGVMLLMTMAEIDVSAHPNVKAWQDRCYARESLSRAQALK